MYIKSQCLLPWYSEIHYIPYAVFCQVLFKSVRYNASSNGDMFLAIYKNTESGSESEPGAFPESKSNFQPVGNSDRFGRWVAYVSTSDFWPDRFRRKRDGRMQGKEEILSLQISHRLMPVLMKENLYCPLCTVYGMI